jgi:hypothetical protein
MGTLRFFAAVLVTALIGTMSAPVGAQTPRVTPPLSLPQAQYYQQHPQELQQLLDRLQPGAQSFTPGKPLAAGETPAAGAWTTLTNLPAGGTIAVQNPVLMTDGTVIAMQPCTGKWYKLTPDITGSYLNGTWAQIATMPSGYGPLFGGSGVLPDGRVIFEGGEYNDSTQSGNCGNGAWTSLGAIYDPVANTWTNVNPPSGWTSVGDAAGIVLNNGTYMQSNCCDTSGVSGLSALFNPTTLTWTATGSSKLDRWDEEGMAMLQNGNVLVVDAHTNQSCTQTTELYNSSTGTFSATGSTVDLEPDCTNPTHNLSFELGPVVTRQDGSAVAFPGILCSDAANSNCANLLTGFVVVPKIDLYNVSAGTWSTLATMPQIVTPPFNSNPGGNFFYSLADAPAAVLPDGNVLFAASPSFQAFVPPSHFFELNLSSGTITQVGDTADASSSNGGAYEQNFLVLPTGQVLGVSQLGNVQIYTPLAGSPQASWAPVITSAPGCVSPGVSYPMAGTQLNGLTEGSYYGDDVQAAVNFPVVRIVNNGTSNVYYSKTFNHSSRSIAPNAVVRTNFKVASATALGASKLFDVGAGIPSVGTAVTVKVSCPGGLTDTHDFNGNGQADIVWRDTANHVALWLMNNNAVASSAGLATVPSTLQIVGQHDFNGDGFADLLWRDSTNGTISMWLMNGTSVSQEAVISNVPTTFALMGTGDLNNDGKGDLLWYNTSNGSVSVWFMNGTAVAGSATIGSAPPATWSIVGNTNGAILWRDTSGDIALWGVQNGQVVSSSGLGTVPSNFVVQGLGDFNGDGFPDILWRDNNSGTISIWFTNGQTVTSAGVVSSLSGGWNIAQIGDYNGDGKSDLLLMDGTGDVAMWLMNGATVSQPLSVTNVGPSWTVQNTNVN